MLTYSIAILKTTRTALVSQINDLTLEQLNHIPAGFNNNIIWSLGHMMWTQQGICYKRAGITPIVAEKYFEYYRGGTKPEYTVLAEEVEDIKQLLFSTIDRLETDLAHNVFDSYTEWSTRYGLSVTTIEEALQFLTFHDGIHNGAISALKHLV
jgi:hypothetical protein